MSQPTITPMNIVVNLLNKWEVRNIISLDDQWVLGRTIEVLYSEGSKASFEQIFQVINSKMIDLEKECGQIQSDFEDYSLIQEILNINDLDEFLEKLPKVLENDRSKLFQILTKYHNPDQDYSSPEVSLQRLALVLQELKGQGYNVLVTNKFDQGAYDQLEGRSLLLLDRDMGGDTSSIFGILESVVHKKDVALIVTNDPKELSTRENIAQFVRDHFTEYKHLATSFLWVLKKDEVETTNLAHSVKNVLQGFAIHNLTESYHTLYAEAVKRAGYSLRTIDPEDYENYFDVSYKEGSHLNETVLRIRESLLLQHQYEILSENDKYIEDLLKNRELLESVKKLEIALRTVGPGESQIEVAVTKADKFYDLDQDSKVLSIHSFEQWDYNVNVLAAPIYTGDLFSKVYYDRDGNASDTSTLYLLVTQPCDTLIRMDGNSNLTRGTKLAVCIKGEFLAYGSTQYRREIRIDVPNKLPIHFVKRNGVYGMVVFDLKNSVQIDFRVLDLCAISADGVGRLKQENLSRAIFMPTLSQRYYETGIKEFITKYQFGYPVNRFEALFGKFYNENKEDGEDGDLKASKLQLEKLKGKMIRMAQDAFATNELILPSDVTLVNDKGFTIRRIARLDEIYSLNVINKFADYTSRQAMPTYML